MLLTASAATPRDSSGGTWRGHSDFYQSLGRAIEKTPKSLQKMAISIVTRLLLSRLTRLGAEAYIRPIGAPFRKLRRDGAPPKLLTGTVNMHPTVLGRMSFAGCLDRFDVLPAYRQRGSPDPRAV
jgi:hypothetical protein